LKGEGAIGLWFWPPLMPISKSREELDQNVKELFLEAVFIMDG
jgi:hypothetical protein